MSYLTTLRLFPSNITTSNNHELHGQLDRIEQYTESVKGADPQRPDQAAQENTNNMAQGASRTHPNVLSDKIGDV
jgi:hypothetical protein